MTKRETKREGIARPTPGAAAATGAGPLAPERPGERTAEHTGARAGQPTGEGAGEGGDAPTVRAAPGAAAPGSDAAAFALQLDRGLPLPVGTQLRGQIEYGIATGEIARGTRLPSVRELARQLELAPATVAQVYKELRGQGLLESQQGRGTFVPERLPPHQEPATMVALRRAVDTFFAAAVTLGFSRAAAAEAATLRATHAPTGERGLHVLFVGIFDDASEAYTAAIRDHLRRGDSIAWTTFEAGAVAPRADRRRPDVYVTVANRESELRALVGGSAPVLSLTFIPSRETRTRLAALPPDARVAAVASIPEFLPTLQRNVTRFCPHVKQVEAAPLGAPSMARLLRWCSALVYATGTRAVLTSVPPQVDAFEFRYEPEAGSIARLLLPTLESVRHGRAPRSDA